MRRSTILQPKYNNSENNCDNNLLASRYEEIVQQYEDPIIKFHTKKRIFIEKR